MRKYILVVMVVFVTQNVMGQRANKPDEAKKSNSNQTKSQRNNLSQSKNKTYRHFVGGFKFVTDGYGGFLEYGISKSPNKALLFQLDISERKHLKETKSQSLYPNTSPLIYGKVNFFYPVRLGVQKSFVFGNKGDKNGVQISGNIGGGISLGLLRPYQIQIYNDSSQSFEFINHNSADSGLYASLYDPYKSVIGGPDFGKGWNQMKLNPGIYLKPALRFDYGKYSDVISGIEVGVNAEFYSKKIQQMVHIAPKQYFLGAYVSIFFGRRK